VHPAGIAQLPDAGPLAEVIHLSTAARTRAEPDRSPASAESPPPGPPLDGARAVELLRRRYGARWSELPADLGRVALAAEHLLDRGPTAVRAGSTAPETALREAALTVRAAATHAPVLDEESEVLGAALAAELADLPLRELDRVVGAVLALGVASPAEPAWAAPADADAARLVLDAAAADVRAAADLHRDVYERFTAAVWEVREARLRAGRRRWRFAARWRLRRELAAVSRSGKVPGSLSELSDLLVGARAARQRIADLAPLLDRHLGRHHQGPLTDISTATASLDAVRRLQQVLDGRLDVDRLRGLLEAEAFASPEVSGPALSLRTALRAWQAEVAQLCGGDPWAIRVRDLPGWAARTEAALPALDAARRAVADLGQVPATLRSLVDDLMLREHAEATQVQGSRPAGAVRWSAS
jgi:hypothetical protein